VPRALSQYSTHVKVPGQKQMLDEHIHVKGTGNINTVADFDTEIVGYENFYIFLKDLTFLS
jgi:hypothetical protein